MAYPRQKAVNVVTLADGSAIAYSDEVLCGRLVSIIYKKDATAPFSDGSTFTVTTERTEQSLWSQSAVNASAQVNPRMKTHDIGGAESKYAESGANVYDNIRIAYERVKITIANGGDSRAGRFILILE